MKPRPALPLLALFAALLAHAPALAHDDHSIQEQLGYDKDAKLLIIHADDLGAAHSKNIATFKAMEEGVVTSASIMMNTPWVVEVINYSNEHPEADLGIHITLTAEWETYKWGPVLGRDQVPSLVTEQGYFHSSVPEFAAAATLEEIEAEVRAQIEYAKKVGIEFSHLDGHMGSMLATDEIAELYIALGKEYGVPVRLHRHHGQRVESATAKAAVESMPGKLDGVYGAPPDSFPEGMEEYYNDVLRDLKPGLNILVVHLGFDDAEMQAITVDHPLWGSKWRQIDYDWSMNPATRKLIEDEGIILVDWGDVKEKLFDHQH